MVTLEGIKLNLQLEDDEDDLWIAGRIDEALELLSLDCNRVIYNTQALYDAVDAADLPANSIVLTLSMERAVTMLISHWFMNRESHTDAKLIETPLGYQHIVDRYRVHSC